MWVVNPTINYQNTPRIIIAIEVNHHKSSNQWRQLDHWPSFLQIFSIPILPFPRKLTHVEVSMVMGVPHNGWFVVDSSTKMDDDWGSPHLIHWNIWGFPFMGVPLFSSVLDCDFPWFSHITGVDKGVPMFHITQLQRGYKFQLKYLLWWCETNPQLLGHQSQPLL